MIIPLLSLLLLLSLLVTVIKQKDPVVAQTVALLVGVYSLMEVLCSVLRATQVRAYDDRAIGSFVRHSYVSTLCPDVICPYLCTSEVWWGRLADRVGRKPALLIGLAGSAVTPILFGTQTCYFYIRML